MVGSKEIQIERLFNVGWNLKVLNLRDFVKKERNRSKLEREEQRRERAEIRQLLREENCSYN